MATNFQSLAGSGGPMAINNTIALDRTELLKWDGRRSEGRRYLTSQPNDTIEILPVIATYSTRVREFFGWFWAQIESSNYPAIMEYRCKSGEFAHYLLVEDTLVRFGPDGPSALKRPLAAARRERAVFGTSGWRLITRDENGEWVVGNREADWPPLPPGPRAGPTSRCSRSAEPVNGVGRVVLSGAAG